MNLITTLVLLLILAANLGLSGCRSAHTEPESPPLEEENQQVRSDHQIHAIDGRGDEEVIMKLEIYRKARGGRSGGGYGAAGFRRPPHQSKSPASSLTTTTPPLFLLAATLILLFFLSAFSFSYHM